MSTNEPEKTLFGTIFDSNKLLTKIDYTDFYNGKWSKNKELKEALKQGKFINDPDYENAKRTTAKQKVRFDDSLKIYNDSRNSALNFNNNFYYSNPKTNQFQVEDYNSMRKTKSSLAFQNRRKPTDVYKNTNSYQLNGDMFQTGNNLTFHPSTSYSVSNPQINSSLEYVDNYLAADGTNYKIYNAPSGHTVKEINCPTRNIIHVPGKYHEHYRNTVVSDEVPQNIKHRFRTDQTNELLKDQLKVHDTLSHLQNSGIIKKNDKTDDENKSAYDLKTDKNISDYYDLGNHLRHIICHGYPTVVKQSHKETVHNNELSKEYLSSWSENVESPWRRRKDWIGKWTDKDVVDRRTEKMLATIRAEKSKGATNT